jgi:beta-lactamase class A
VLVLVFAGTAIWRLALLGLETYEASRFTRPAITTPARTAPPVTDAGLDLVLRGTGLPGGTVGSYVRIVGSGAGAGLNADRRFPAASLYKLPVMLEVFKQQRLRNFNWDDDLTIQQSQWADGSGVLQARVGQKIKVHEALRLMITDSDNIAANMLVDLVGPNNINQTLEGLGLRQTRVVDRSREAVMPTTSAEDIGRLLELLASGRFLDPQTSEEAIRLLEAKQGQNWLGEGIPWWGKIAHKWGDLPNARHDAGIIFTPHNQIVLVVLTENGAPAQAAEVIRSTSQRILDYVEGPGP